MNNNELLPALAGSKSIAANDTTDDFIKSRIFTIRGVQVMLDRDLAELYGVQTKVLNQAVKRNANRFPHEFMFILAKDETDELVTNCDRFASMKHSSVPMRAFSEHGVIMVASVLKSEIAAHHDRFLILDGSDLYHIGASLKDLGRKYCAVTKMDAMFIPSILQRI